ncbi:MAG TPA: tetratricopeptide repeat protein [Candidatus Hydrogenedentes bacterium]|nr:tetratricopeptide repeat protein [Candidatus Hydrogenedentota bacterium]HPG66281.1 tetratricopeptide repeat protein [Candidatus Hydrogenedentota bacterium]
MAKKNQIDPPAPVADDGGLPSGAYEWLLGVAGLAFAALMVFVLAFGTRGEQLTAGVDAACARAAFESGKKMEALGNYDQAIAFFHRALEGHFDEKEREYMCRRSIAELYVRMGRYADAIDVYRNLPPEALASPGSLTGYVTALYRDGRYDEAEQLGLKWLAMAHDAQDKQLLIWANHTMGLICHEMARPDEVLPYFQAVRTIDPANRANLDMARILLRQQNYQEALLQVDALLSRTEPGLLHKEAEDLRARITAASQRQRGATPPAAPKAADPR